MNNRIRNLVKAAQESRQPVLSVFMNLQNEDHSFKKLRSLFVKARNELRESGQKIDKLEELLADNRISGFEFQPDTGLGDVNIAVYVLKDKVETFSCSRSFNDQYCINDLPFVAPLVEKRRENIKILSLMRNQSELYSYKEGELTKATDDFPTMREYDLSNFDNQTIRDRTKKRSDEIFKNHVSEVLAKAFKTHFSKGDKILIVAAEELLPHAKEKMEASEHKRSYVAERFNFSHFKQTQTIRKIKELVDKNKMADYRPEDDNKTRSFHSLNSVKKETGPFNIRHLNVKEDLLQSALTDMSGFQNLNSFLASLSMEGVSISSYENLDDNFSVDLWDINAAKAYGSI